MRRISSKFIAAGAVLAFFGATSTAGAAGLSGSSPFTSSNAGLAAHEFTVQGGALRFTCTTVAGSGTVNPTPVDASGDPRTASVDPAFSGCTWNIAGLRLQATVTDTCTWTLAIATFTAPGTSTGTFGPGCTVSIKPPQDCTIHLQPFSGSVAGQNLASPTRLRAATTASGITWSTTGANCGGINPGGTDGTYTGTLDHAGLQAVA